VGLNDVKRPGEEIVSLKRVRVDCYSMMGPDAEVCNGPVSAEAGIIPRFCHELFERIASLDDSRVRMSAPSSETATIFNTNRVKF